MDEPHHPATRRFCRPGQNEIIEDPLKITERAPSGIFPGGALHFWGPRRRYTVPLLRVRQIDNIIRAANAGAAMQLPAPKKSISLQI